MNLTFQKDNHRYYFVLFSAETCCSSKVITIIDAINAIEQMKSVKHRNELPIEMCNV